MRWRPPMRCFPKTVAHNHIPTSESRAPHDDRGCDIVFATREKLLELYPLLKPYFLAYDAEEMERRYGED